MSSSGKLIIFSAPSGAGKTTLVHHVLRLFPQLQFSVSACSRDKRANEVHGKDYYFLGVDEFRNKIQDGAFVEWEEVYEGQYYGTLKSEIERIWQQGKHVIFDVDVVGGLNLKRAYGRNALSIFVKAPSIEHLEKRLRARETETDQSIAKRMAKAESEMKFAEQFDKVILNDDLSQACLQAENLVAEFLSAN